MNYFPPPAQWKKPRGRRPDPPSTCGSSREQTMPKVAPKLSLSQSPTAWMQPRTWMMLSSSRRWKKSGEKHRGFHWEVGFGGRCYFSCLLLLASQRSGVRNVWESISWIGPFPGFSCQKTVPGSYGPHARRYWSSLLWYSPAVTSGGLKSSFSPTTKPQNTTQDQYFPRLIQKDHAKAYSDYPNMSRACPCSASLSNGLRCQGKAIKMNLYTAAVTATLGGEELTCR